MSNNNSIVRGVLCVIVVVGYVLNANGFSVGVPPVRTVCRSMNPQHHDYTAQGTESPFEISVNANQVSGGSNVLVSLASIDPKTKFIGFYVQARDENDVPIGSFTPIKTDTKVHSCGGMRANGAHHASGNVKKDNVTISWTAPRQYDGEVVFTATAVRDFVTYWVFLQTPPVMVIKEIEDPSSPVIQTSYIRGQSQSPSFNSVGLGGIQPFSQLPVGQPPRFGEGIRMIFQNLGGIANSFGSIFNPNRNRNRDMINGNGELATRLSAESGGDSLVSPSEVGVGGCGGHVFKRLLCSLFQNQNAQN